MWGETFKDSPYWIEPWSSLLFSGDLFEAIPFGLDTTELYTIEKDPIQHFQGQIALAYGMLITPSCDMYEGSPPTLAHKFRVLVPVLDLRQVVEETKSIEKNVDQIRKRDHLRAYMYLPPLKGHVDESLAALYRPTLVSDDFLADPPRRVAQMHHLARRHLKAKLALYWGRVEIDEQELPERERDEETTTSKNWPRSRYDTGQKFDR